MKKALILILSSIVLLLPLSASENTADPPASTVSEANTDALPYSRKLGIEVNKPAKNVIKVVDGNTSVDLKTITYDEIKELPTVKRMEFGNPMFDLQTGEVISGANTPSFKVIFDIETQGTLLVFFSSNDDLGFYDTVNYYKNPYMLESVEKVGINYQVDVVGSLYNKGSKGNPVEVEKSFNNLHHPYASIEEKKIIDLDTPVPPGFIKPKSGLVFTRRMASPPAAAGAKSGVRGCDTYTMTLLPAKDDSGNAKPYDAGLYSGHVVIHFSTNV